MKRNKLKARGIRQHNSPYKKAGKTPCKHCQQVTADSRRRAQSGAELTQEASHDNG